MQPNKDDTHISIPLTFNSRFLKKTTATSKWFFGIIYVAFLVFGVVYSFTRETWGSKLLWLFGVVTAFIYLFRFHILEERRYRKLYRKLKKNNYLFNHDVFWRVTDITESFPYICTLDTGVRAIFVSLKKGISVGKGEDFAFRHQMQVAEAYKTLMKSNIEVIHLDYMDSLGNDPRLNYLFEEAKKDEGEALRDVLTMLYSHVELTMNNTFTSYDTYVFYFRASHPTAWEDIQTALSQLREGNYDSYRVLGKKEIAELAASIYGLSGVSFNQMQDFLFKRRGIKPRLNIIWVEKDGERTQVSETSEVKARKEAIKQAEKSVRTKGVLSKLGRKGKETDDIDLG